jgi:hypothetical protein
MAVSRGWRVFVILALLFFYGDGEDVIFLPGCPGIHLHGH